MKDISIINDFVNPFLNKSGRIKFKYQVTGFKCVAYQIPYDREGKIFIPEVLHGLLKLGIGIVLSVGKGYYNKNGEFITPKFQVGDKVIFDKSIPWELDVYNHNDKNYSVNYMSIIDIAAKIEGEKITPFGKKVLIQESSSEKVTSSVLIVIDNSGKTERFKWGKVIEIGDEVLDVKVGDDVYYDVKGTVDFKMGDKKYEIVDIDGILCKNKS